MSSSVTEPVIDAQNGTITWTPTTEGRFGMVVYATDSLGNGVPGDSWLVQVMPDTVSLDAELQLSPSNIIDLGESVTLSVLPQNESSSLTVTLMVDGQSVTIDALLQAQMTPTRGARYR